MTPRRTTIYELMNILPQVSGQCKGPRLQNKIKQKQTKELNLIKTNQPNKQQENIKK